MKRTKASTCRQQGFTLIEAAVSIAVMGVLAIGISAMMFGAVEKQMHQQVHMYEQSLLSSLSFLLRTDGTQAATIVRNNANQVTITMTNGDRVTYRFNLANGGQTTVTRELLPATAVASTTFDYMTLMPLQYRARHTITCGGGGVNCIELTTDGRLSIRNLVIRDTSPVSGVMETAFNQKSFYMLPEVSISTMQGFTFP